MQNSSMTKELETLPNALQNSCEVRVDPIHQWSVIYAPDRANRPSNFSKRKTVTCGEDDPFAEHREKETTPETFAIRNPGSKPNSPNWQVRIVPNKYPAIVPASNFSAGNVPNNSDAHGVHEVIIECPQPETHLTQLPLSQVQLVFQSYQQRLQQLAETGQIAHATIFKNHGPNAGASLAHSHSQLLGTNFVPPLIQNELTFASDYFERTQKNYFEQLLTKELEIGTRVVEQTEDFVVLCPNASRFGFEMHVYPRKQESHFHLTLQATTNHLAEIMLQSLQRLEKVAASPDYNFVLHSAAFDPSESLGFGWHWEIYPRISGIAGWEMGAGSFVNPLFPEQSAEMLRKALS